jgi:transcriptional regulator with XRE-family HTH domain
MIMIYYYQQVTPGGEKVKLTLNVDKVKEYMKFKGWDERALAEEMGVSYEQVYRVFRGKRYPGNEFIAKILKACAGADFEQLFIFNEVLPIGNENLVEGRESHGN